MSHYMETIQDTEDSLFDNADMLSLDQLIDDIWQEQMLEECLHASDSIVWDGSNLDVFNGII